MTLQEFAARRLTEHGTLSDIPYNAIHPPSSVNLVERVDDNLAIILDGLYSCNVELQCLFLFFNFARVDTCRFTQGRLHWHHWNKALHCVRKLWIHCYCSEFNLCGILSELLVGASNVEELHLKIKGTIFLKFELREIFTMTKLRWLYLSAMTIHRSELVAIVQKYEDTLELLHLDNCRILDDSEELMLGTAYYPTIAQSTSFTDRIATNVAAVSREPR